MSAISWSGTTKLAVCRRDHLGADVDPETVTARAWGQDGEPQIVTSDGVPNLRSKNGGQQLLSRRLKYLEGCKPRNHAELPEGDIRTYAGTLAAMDITQLVNDQSVDQSLQSSCRWSCYCSHIGPIITPCPVWPIVSLLECHKDDIILPEAKIPSLILPMKRRDLEAVAGRARLKLDATYQNIRSL